MPHNIIITVLYDVCDCLYTLNCYMILGLLPQGKATMLSKSTPIKDLKESGSNLLSTLTSAGMNLPVVH